MWKEAARKIYSGSLGAIFIECSYDSSQPDSALYGHLSPAHLIAELKVLGGYVEELRHADNLKRKRKRLSSGYHNPDPEIEGRRRSIPHLPPHAAPSATTTAASLSTDMEDDTGDIGPTGGRPMRELQSCPPESPPPSPSAAPPLSATAAAVAAPAPASLSAVYCPSLRPLNALRIVITHVKDTMTGVDVPAKVLADLEALEREAGLGCTFMLAKQGASIYF